MASRGGALWRLLVDRRAWVPSVGTPDVVDAAMARAFSPNAPRRRSFRVGASGGLTPVLATGNVSLETPAFCVWGANTAVGKTLVSAGLAAAARRRALPFLYLKPVQTGFPDDSDAEFVATRARAGVVPTMGPHAAVAAGFENPGTNDLGTEESGSHRGTAFPVAEGGGSLAASGPPFWAHTTFAWRRATGPQAAAAEEGRFVTDEELLYSVTNHLAQFNDAVIPGGGFGSSTGFGSFGSVTAESLTKNETSSDGFVLVETAGGVCSPGPSGTLQCDLYRPMRLPAVLVGDGELGGISTTIAAYEALHARGYDVVSVVLADHGHGNAAAINKYCESVAPPSSGATPTPVFVLPPIPPRDLGLSFVSETSDSKRENSSVMTSGIGVEPQKHGSEILGWLDEGKATFDQALAHMVKSHAARVSSLRSAPARARRDLWWPFTQHDLVGDVTVIDSRSGEDFGVYVPDADATRPGAVHLRFDASASWWTQGVSKESAFRLHRAAAGAAGRWGHVMFPENAHDAALDASLGLLDGAGKGWAKRVFFSDNGSTAMEVAVKMAMRLWYVRKGFVNAGGDAQGAGNKNASDTSEDTSSLPQVRVLALDGSYHGDTLGTMDMQAPSVFTGPMQTPWYKPRGLFLSPPTAQMRKGKWVVEQPKKGLCLEKCHGCACDFETPETRKPGVPGASEFTEGFETRSEVFDVEARASSGLAGWYAEKIDQVLDVADAAAAENPSTHPPLAALVMECVLHGAGGMDLIDPLFQRVLMQRCKARGMPVVLDEVFAGIWRLGAEGAWQLLKETPDISCYAKLLTGGLVPLAATAATEEVFDAFRGNTKAQGLLHGHSYTAYPVGCAVAAEAMRLYKDPEANPNLHLVERKDKKESLAFSESSETGAEETSSALTTELRLRDLWDESAARELSMLPNVKGVTVIGCVLAVELDDGSGGGYNSTATKEVVNRLKRAASVQARPLGNVLYLMCAPTTSAERCTEIMAHVSREVQAAAMGDDDEAW